MSVYLEIWGRSGTQLTPLDEDRVSVGSAPTNAVVLSDDPLVSRLHAVLELYTGGWTIRDLGSRNGTFVNGERLTGERALRPGDEVRLGETRLVYRSDTAADPPTEGARPAPEVTRREREVLVALCRPVLAGSLVSEPATLREIAAELVVSESAVKKHLLNLYDKFELWEPGERRRGRLAAEAVQRGAVRLADLHDRPEG